MTKKSTESDLPVIKMLELSGSEFQVPMINMVNASSKKGGKYA